MTGSALALENARRLVAAGADGEALYSRWFHEETGDTLQWPSPAAYRAAILDPSRYEPGWRVLQALPQPAGAVLAMRGGRERIMAPPEMTPDSPRDLSPAKGSSVRADPFASGESGGFWHVWSAGWQRSAPTGFYRIYCRFAPSRALAFVRAVTQAAPARPQWSMKALCGAQEAGRRDCALLYLSRELDCRDGWPAALLARIGPLCHGDPPPFVEPLSPGIGRAPDPGGGISFGQAVSRAVASAAHHANDAGLFAARALDAIHALPGMQP